MVTLLMLASDTDIRRAVNTDGSPVSADVVNTARLFRVPYDEVTDAQHKRARYYGQYGGGWVRNVRRWEPIGGFTEDTAVHTVGEAVEESAEVVGLFNSATLSDDLSGIEARVFGFDPGRGDFTAFFTSATKKAGKKKPYGKSRRHERWYTGKDHG